LRSESWTGFSRWTTKGGANDQDRRYRSPRGRRQGKPAIVSEGDTLLTEDELEADVEKLHASQVEDLEFERELGLVNRRVRSYDPKTLDVLRTFKAVDDDADWSTGSRPTRPKLHLRALEIRKGQGKADDYTADEYILAIEKAAA
jgi:hypothetical protein